MTVSRSTYEKMGRATLYNKLSDKYGVKAESDNIVWEKKDMIDVLMVLDAKAEEQSGGDVLEAADTIEVAAERAQDVAEAAQPLVVPECPSDTEVATVSDSAPKEAEVPSAPHRRRRGTASPKAQRPVDFDEWVIESLGDEPNVDDSGRKRNHTFIVVEEADGRLTELMRRTDEGDVVARKTLMKMVRGQVEAWANERGLLTQPTHNATGLGWNERYRSHRAATLLTFIIYGTPATKTLHRIAIRAPHTAE